MKSLSKSLIITISMGVLVTLLYLCIFNKEFIVDNYAYKDGCIEQVVNYKELYSENKLHVKYGNKVLGYKEVKNVTLENEIDVDTSELGTYEVIYEVNYKNEKKKIKKVVTVKDMDAPVISVAEPLVKVCPNTNNYSLEYSAVDNYDGDITAKVEQKIDGDYLVLKASDFSGNIATKKIDIKYIDDTKPVIKLKGDSHIKLVVGSNYNEQGATATDNCDGDLTSKIIIDGSVNTNKIGTYNISYKVTDSNDNVETITRKVSIYPKNNTNNSGKIIYLTFDDGPGPYTQKLLNVLEKYNVKATFFVTNQYPTYQSMIKKEYEAGHTVGIHTYSHDYAYIYKSINNYFADLNRINSIIKKQTGMESKIVRLPGGSSNTISKQYAKGIMTDITISLSQQGYKYFDWNVTSGDAGNTTSTSKVVSNVVSAMHGNTNLVVLQHDIKNFSVNAVEEIIQEGLIRGYTFAKIDEFSYTSHHKVNN